MVLGETVIEIDCAIMSMNEPQLDRCLRSLREQTYPFARIININGVIPICDAWNRAVQSVSAPWFCLVGGDAIYDRGALARTVRVMEVYPHDKCCGYCVPLYDPFLEIKCGFLCLLRTEPFQQQTATDELVFDRKVMRNLRRRGWFLKKNFRITVGTHFENPDDFQVFHRFFILATKEGQVGYEINKGLVEKQYKKYGNPLHLLALDAMEFALTKGAYGRSINQDYNLAMYEEFKTWKLTH